jgi:hypothetical protein
VGLSVAAPEEDRPHRDADDQDCENRDKKRHVKQVADWLGHADPSFTLRTYVHLLDAGVGGADFLDEAVYAAEPESVTATDQN